VAAKLWLRRVSIQKRIFSGTNVVLYATATEANAPRAQNRVIRWSE